MASYNFGVKETIELHKGARCVIVEPGSEAHHAWAKLGYAQEQPEEPKTAEPKTAEPKAAEPKATKRGPGRPKKAKSESTPKADADDPATGKE